MKAGGGQSWTERKGGAHSSSLGPWGRVRGTPAAGEWGGGGEEVMPGWCSDGSGGSPGLEPRAGPARVLNRRCRPRAHPPSHSAGRGPGVGGGSPGTASLAPLPRYLYAPLECAGRAPCGRGRGFTLAAARRGGPRAAGPLNRPPWRWPWPVTDPASEPRPDAGHHAAPPPGTAPAALAAAAAALPCSPHCPQSPGPPRLPEAGDPWPRGQPWAPLGSCSPHR